jgi:hypothetical protein
MGVTHNLVSVHLAFQLDFVDDAAIAFADLVSQSDLGWVTGGAALLWYSSLFHRPG